MKTSKRGFTMIEVLIATMILAMGLFTILTSMSQCAKMMLASKNYQDAQYVLNLGEMLYPIPDTKDLSGDPLDDERLNIDPVEAHVMIDDLEMKVSKKLLESLEGYTFERAVDEIEQEELDRNGKIYTLRTTVRWGTKRGETPQQEVVIRYVRKD